MGSTHEASTDRAPILNNLISVCCSQGSTPRSSEREGLKMPRYKDVLKIFWRPVFVLLCLAVTALLFHQFNSQEGRCGACVLLVGSLWASEALALEVTSLLPILLLPLLGIMSTGDVSKEYFTGANMMMMAAMGIAAAVQNVRLHQRIALGILMMTGAGKKTLLLSFMVITCGISMFICNTATCAMMCPILKVVLDEVYKSKKEKSADTLSAESEETQPFECCEASKHKQQRRMVSSGVGLNLITLAVSVIAASTYGCPLLGMHEFPIWANTTDCSIVAASYQ